MKIAREIAGLVVPNHRPSALFQSPGDEIPEVQTFGLGRRWAGLIGLATLKLIDRTGAVNRMSQQDQQCGPGCNLFGQGEWQPV